MRLVLRNRFNKVITLQDIAREAGVSIATASMALNDHPSISAKTKARIYEIQQRLGYRPNRFARQLRKRVSGSKDSPLTTGNLAFLLIDRSLEDPAYSPFLQGISESVVEHR
jgi:DNA-binding LacI/PurR family transcriptional regulator